MVKDSEEQLDGIFHALSDRTRRAILYRLAEGECHVTELAEPFHMSLAAVSKHIKVLEDSGLVQKTKSGRNLRCQANFESLDHVNALLERLAHYWQDRLAALDQFLLTTGDNDGNDKHGPSQDERNKRTKHSQAGDKKGAPRKKRKSV